MKIRLAEHLMSVIIQWQQSLWQINWIFERDDSISGRAVGGAPCDWAASAGRGGAAQARQAFVLNFPLKLM